MVEIRHLPCRSDKGEERLLTIASGPVIIEKNKVLLNKHEDSFWKFPGGSIDSKDNFEEAAVREVKEEVGLDVELIGEPYILSFDWERDRKKEYVILVHYLAKRLNKKIKLGEGVEKAEWFNIDDLPGECAPNIKPVIEYFKNKI